MWAESGGKHRQRAENSGSSGKTLAPTASPTSTTRMNLQQGGVGIGIWRRLLEGRSRTESDPITLTVASSAVTLMLCESEAEGRRRLILPVAFHYAAVVTLPQQSWRLCGTGRLGWHGPLGLFDRVTFFRKPITSYCSLRSALKTGTARHP